LGVPRVSVVLVITVCKSLLLLIFKNLMIPDQNWTLLAKYLSGEASSQEKEIVDEWRKKTEDNQKLFELLQRVWIHKTISGSKGDVDLEKKWLDTLEKLDDRSSSHQKHLQPEWSEEKKEKEDRFFRVGKVAQYAAAAILLVVTTFAGIFLYQFYAEETPGTLVYKSEIGETLEFQLDDGSQVWLAPKSKLEVPADLNGSKREISLEGEAYFSVESNQDKAFWVYTKNSITKVLGTQFNVTAFADESLLEVQVIEGIVAVEKGNRSQGFGDIILNEGDLLKTDEQLNTYEIHSNVSKSAHSKWRQGVIVLDDLSLDRISERLERWFPMEIILESEGLADKNLTAEFRSSQPLEEILQEISLALNIEYKVDQQTVIFY